MLKIEKQEFLDRSTETLSRIFDTIKDLKPVNLNEFDPGDTALVLVDPLKGFAKSGNLYSPRSEALIPELVKLLKGFKARNMPTVVFADTHPENCAEFRTYGEHCLKGSEQSEVVDELKEIGGYTLIEKNSTNGFIEEKFQEWLKNNGHIKNFVVACVLTDFCVIQFATTLKAYFDMINEEKFRVIVPVNAVDTFDFDLHYGDLLNVMGLYQMLASGVELVSSVEV